MFGYYSEISAGGCKKRVWTNFAPKGGTSITWLYEQTHTGDEVCTNEYLVNSTGEVKCKKEKAELRTDNERGVRNSCERFKWKLRANARDARLFITLTYAENMTDTKRLYDDFRKFWQRFKRKFSCTGYLMACEPQERGAWHVHLITIGGADFISNDAEVAPLWGHGYTKTTSCKDVADLGGYLTTYLTKFDGKKGSRLSLYPAGFRFLRWSKGLKEAEIKKGKADEDDKQQSGYTITREKRFEKEIDGLDKKMIIHIIEYMSNSLYSRYIRKKRNRNERFVSEKK